MDNANLEEIEIGFLETIEDWKLTSKHFPCKVGGRPAWLALEELPNVMCTVCNKPLIFLCQVYAPFTESKECFHRTIFIFVCLEGTCNVLSSAANVKVFRCQLGRENKYYSYEPISDSEETEDSPTASEFNKLCFVCGSPGSKICGGCHSINYCSREHQALDWKQNHKLMCKSPESVRSLKLNKKRPLFDEYELDREPEMYELQDEKSESVVMKEYEDLLRLGQEKTDESSSVLEDEDSSDLIKMAAKETDKAFVKFRTRIMDFPGQVFRYHRGGTPLYVSSSNIPRDIPNCQECGGLRQFEFQIMPQMLVHLKVDRPGPSLDWGTLMVFTCAKSCTGRTNYIPESVYKQDYSANIDFLKH